MALNKHNVIKAWYILNAVNPAARNSFIQEFDNDDPFQEDTILGEDRKSDDGWESVFMNVRGLTEEQEELFKQRALEVSNTSFVRLFEKNRDITRIGFF